MTLVLLFVAVFVVLGVLGKFLNEVYLEAKYSSWSINQERADDWMFCHSPGEEYFEHIRWYEPICLRDGLYCARVEWMNRYFYRPRYRVRMAIRALFGETDFL